MGDEDSEEDEDELERSKDLDDEESAYRDLIKDALRKSLVIRRGVSLSAYLGNYDENRRSFSFD